MSTKATSAPVTAPLTVRSQDALADLFMPLYQRLAPENSEFISEFEQKLAAARMSETVELYLSRTLGLGVISGLSLWLLGIMLGYMLFATGSVSVGTVLGVPIADPALLELVIALKIPALVFVTGLVFGAVGFSIGAGSLVAVPYSRASTRRREINMLLPDTISFMYALSVGGQNQLEILEAVARAEDTYGELSREFQSIVQETEYLDTDYRSAIRKQSMMTPSEELSQFLVDMLSIINTGGDMERFFDDKRQKHMRTAKNEQETILDTLELFGEMYMTLSLFPLLLIIVLAAMSMLGQVQDFMILMTVYGLLPLLGIMFLVLLATVKRDEPGSGILTPDEDNSYLVRKGQGLSDVGIVEHFVGRYSIFNRIRNYEGTHETISILTRPDRFFRDNPLYTLALTIPASLVVVVLAAMTGAAPTSWNGMLAQPLWGTLVYLYVPLYLVIVPLAVFREWNLRRRHAVLHNLSDNLRKLSSANDTGLTLLESIKTVADTSPGVLAREFETMYAKVDYGMGLEESLIEFNNRYELPRLARTVKLIAKAQEASNHISAVLSAAAQASENQDDIDREWKTRTQMQVVVIIMTYLTLLGVMAILKTQFIDVMSGLTAQATSTGFGSALDTELLSLLFFHAVTLQAVLSGIIAGYMQTGHLMNGLKYVIAMLSIALTVWVLVG